MGKRGNNRFFSDQAYHFQTLRAFSDIPAGGAEASEILSTISQIREGNDEDWFRAWEHTAVRVERMAYEYRDSTSKGYALLRAHNYYRTAEFFLHYKDERRLASFRKSKQTFFEGLQLLNVPHEVHDVPFGNLALKSILYPAPNPSPDKPLIVFCGGYDSTLEELYFFFAKAATERGYTVLTYEGPGQGNNLREQGSMFTPEWEKPTQAVLDDYLQCHPAPDKIVLVGMSFGGYLAPRAAAFDKRIDGVVAFDVCYDLQDAALRQTPALALILKRIGMLGLTNALARLKMKARAGTRWGVQNAEWTMGARKPSDLLDLFKPYSLDRCADKITCDVLVLAGVDDHFYPVEQVRKFRDKLINARSITTRIYSADEGGHEHCQLGALSLAHATIFDWIQSKFEKTALSADKGEAA